MKKYRCIVSLMVAMVMMMSVTVSVWAQADAAEASKNSFKTIARRLDMYGDILVVANAEDAVEELFNQIVSTAKASGAGSSSDSLAILDKINKFLKENGFYAVNGFGMSVVPRGDGFHKTAAFVARDASAVSLPLWRGLVGGAQKQLKCHAFLPSDTAFVRSSTADLKAIWKMVNSGVMEIGNDSVKKGFTQSMQMMPMMLGMPIEDLLGAMGKEGFISLQLSRTKKVELPTGGMDPSKNISIHQPSFLIAIEVVGDSIPNLLKTRLGTPENPIKTVQTAGGTVYASPMSLPAPIPMQLSFAVKNGILLLGSNPDVVKNGLRASATKRGLFTDPEFKKLFQGLPTKNNGMTYVSKRFSDMIMKVQKASSGAVGAIPGAAGNDQMLKLMQSMQSGKPGQSAVTVTLNWKSGVQTKGVSSVSGRNTVASMSIAPVGLIAAISVPAFMQYRTDAREGLCENNIRLIDHAKGVWAIKNSKMAGDPVDKAGIAVYIKGGMPKCPQGGTYTVGNVDEPAQCSVHSEPSF